MVNTVGPPVNGSGLQWRSAVNGGSQRWSSATVTPPFLHIVAEANLGSTFLYWELHAFKPNFILADMGGYVVSEFVTSVHVVAKNKAKISESKPKSVSEPLIKDWVSDSEDENETETKSEQRKPSFAKIEFVKPNEQMKSQGIC
nr:hypothetical protein [Tanacetum cinerariifolium]